MIGVRPLTSAQQAENAAFLKELRLTGNAREAARRLGMHRAKFTKRRARHPAFAAQWDAALVMAQQDLAQGAAAGSVGGSTGPHLLRRADGTLQVRRARPDAIDAAARTRFLTALSACGNVRLAAKAAGHSHAAFYHHKRRDPAFAVEWRQALKLGYERLELALIAGWSDVEDAGDWQRNDPPAIPPMRPGEALQLLYLHQKEARLWDTPSPLRRRPGESEGARTMRLDLMYEARRQREREDFAIAEREWLARKEAEHQPPPPVLPDLAQVTGWSKAADKPPHHEGRALFGGWRIEDWKE